MSIEISSPGILREGANKRRHYWFGDPLKDHPTVRLLFRFWNAARQGAHDPLFVFKSAAAALVWRQLGRVGQFPSGCKPGNDLV